VRLDDAVRVQQQAVAGREHGFLLLVLRLRHQPQWHAPRTQLDGALDGLHVGQVVARVREPEASGSRLEHAVQAGHEHVRRHVRAQVGVDPLENLSRIDQPLRGGAEHTAGGGHDQGGGNALVGDITDDEPDLSVGERDDVVEVAANLAGGPVEGRDLPAVELGQLSGQEVLLD
jgi:hypothetical protein